MTSDIHGPRKSKILGKGRGGSGDEGDQGEGTVPVFLQHTQGKLALQAPGQCRCSKPLFPSRQLSPMTQPAVSPGWHRHTTRQHAERLLSPAAAELPSTHHSAVTGDRLLQLTMPSGKCPGRKDRESNVTVCERTLCPGQGPLPPCLPPARPRWRSSKAFFR